MTSTEELHRMLDERGIEWYEAGGVTFFGTSGYGTRYAASEPECGIALDPLTPEQAIAATVGRETCELPETPDWCTIERYGIVERCGVTEWRTCSACGSKVLASPVRYCPSCGRMVIE